MALNLNPETRDTKQGEIILSWPYRCLCSAVI